MTYAFILGLIVGGWGVATIIAVVIYWASEESIR